MGSLGAVTFMILGCDIPGVNIYLLHASRVLEDSFESAEDAARRYSSRDRRVLTTDNYECTWNRYASIPLGKNEGKTVLGELSSSRRSIFLLQERGRSTPDKLRPLQRRGFSMEDRIELVKLSTADNTSGMAPRRFREQIHGHDDGSQPRLDDQHVEPLGISAG